MFLQCARLIQLGFQVSSDITTLRNKLNFLVFSHGDQMMIRVSRTQGKFVKQQQKLMQLNYFEVCWHI